MSLNCNDAQNTKLVNFFLCLDGADSLEQLEAESSVWKRVVESLASENEWKAVSLLVLGTDVMPEGPAANCTFDDSGFSLVRLLDLCAQAADVRQWGLRLMVELLKHGVKPKSLLKAPGENVLHLCLPVCMKAGKCETVQRVEY